MSVSFYAFYVPANFITANAHVRSDKSVEDLVSKGIIFVANVTLPVHSNRSIQFYCNLCFNHLLNIVIAHEDKIRVCCPILPVQFVLLSSLAHYFVSVPFHKLLPISSSNYACLSIVLLPLFFQLCSIYNAID